MMRRSAATPALLLCLLALGACKSSEEPAPAQEPVPAAESPQVQALTTACDQGQLVSCSKVGALYETGKGGRRDVERAVRFYDKACSSRNANPEVSNSCYRLAAIYEKGRGVPADITRAVHYLRIACDIGRAKACEAIERIEAGASTPGP